MYIQVQKFDNMALKDFTKEELEDKFEFFLITLPDYMEDFIGRAERSGYSLDYSIDSLVALEQYLLKYNVSNQDADYNDAAAYFGEVVRTNYGGEWRCSFEGGPASTSYGLPVLYGFNTYDLELSPFESVGIFVARPRENHFMTTLNGYVNPLQDKFDLSDLPTEEE